MNAVARMMAGIVGTIVLTAPLASHAAVLAPVISDGAIFADDFEAVSVDGAWTLSGATGLSTDRSLSGSQSLLVGDPVSGPASATLSFDSQIGSLVSDPMNYVASYAFNIKTFADAKIATLWTAVASSSPDDLALYLDSRTDWGGDGDADDGMDLTLVDGNGVTSHKDIFQLDTWYSVVIHRHGDTGIDLYIADTNGTGDLSDDTAVLSLFNLAPRSSSGSPYTTTLGLTSSSQSGEFYVDGFSIGNPTTQPIPEPASITLMLTAGAMIFRRRK